MELREYLATKTSPVANEKNIIEHKKYRVTVLQSQLFRIEYGDKDSYTDKATQRVFFRNHAPVSYKTIEKNDSLQVQTEDCTLVLKDTLQDSYIILNGNKVLLDNKENLKGTTRTLDMCGGEYLRKVWRNGEYKMMNFRDLDFLEDGAISKNGVAVLDDSESFIINEKGLACPREKQEKDIYIFAYGRDYKKAVKGMFSICGASPMLPKYVFGNWWSRYFAYSDKSYKKLMNTFSKKNVPLTVATLDMDWHYVNLEKEIGEECKGLRGWTGWSWNKELFPNPEELMNWLHNKGLRVTLNLHPADGIRFYEDCYKDVCEYIGQDWTKGEPVVFDFSDPLFINAYFDVVIKGLEKQGVDFWWIDWQQGVIKEGKQGTYDPLWGLNHYSYLASQRDNRRPLILSRYSGWGSHRYPIGFSGDSIITWEMLDYIQAFTARASNVGYYFWSHDIGGHIEGIKDDELYIRWLEFARFSPILRLHSTNQDLMGKEPWNFAKGTEYIAEELLRQRARLVPYIYSLSARAHFEGEPFIKPMYYEYPNDERAYKVDSQYYFGDLLVAPIAKKTDEKSGLAKKSVWLPKGKWYELSTGIIYEGDRMIDIYRYIEETPVFMPYNSMYIEEENNRFNINIFGEEAELQLYEDDGETLDYEKNLFNITDIKVHKEKDEVIISIMPGKHTELIEKNRNYSIQFMDLSYADIWVNQGNYQVDTEDSLIINIDKSNTDKELIIRLKNIVAISNSIRIDNRIDKMFIRQNGENLTLSRLYKMVKENGSSSLQNNAYLPEQFIDAIKEIF